MNTQETGAILAIIKGGWQHQWRGQQVDEPLMLKTYQLGLRDVAYADAEIAVASCIESCKFIPTVAEIRERLPRSATALSAGNASKRAPRSAYELGYLPWPADGSLVTDEVGDDVPTLWDILAREESKPEPPSNVVMLPERTGTDG